MLTLSNSLHNSLQTAPASTEEPSVKPQPKDRGTGNR